MKKIVSSILAFGVLINLNADTDLNNKIDSYKLYNIDLEKIILEEMVSSITHEENIFNMYNDYILKTGDTNVTNFYSWYKIDNNYNNNFVKAFNHNGLIELEYNQTNGSLLIKKTFKKENSFASKKYMEELKNRSIRFSFDANGYSIVAYKLPLKTIKFIDKYKEIKSQGLGLVNENELDNTTSSVFNSIAINTHIYVPNGEGGFLLYEKKPTKSNYLGLVNTFDGVFINGYNNLTGKFLTEIEIVDQLSLKLPKIKGSIGYVVTNIDNNEKSAIVEYIYNGTTWVKRYSSVNTQSTIRTKITDYNQNSMIKSNSTDLNIDENTLSFFDSAFVGGLYNKNNIFSQTNPILERVFENYGNQSKTAIFKNKYLVNTYDWKNINAESKIYSSSSKENLIGNIEEISISAENYNFKKEFKADTSACAMYGYYYGYNAATDKCVKSVTSCSNTDDSLYDQKSINGKNYCFVKNTTTAKNKVCDLANSSSLVNNASFEYLPLITNEGCVDKFTGSIPNNDPYDSLPYKIIDNRDIFQTKYRVDTVSPICNDFKDNAGLMVVSSENDTSSKPIGCYWTPIQNNDIKEPFCNEKELRIGGVCKSLLNSNEDAANAGCIVTNSEIDKFNSLVTNYMFQNSVDASKYIYGDLVAEKTESTITDPITHIDYKVCDHIKFSQKGFKKSYLFPKLSLKIDNVALQGKNEIKTNPLKIVYREINISECDVSKTNCKSIFDKSKFNFGLQNNGNIKFDYGDIFNNTEYLNFNTTTRYFDINKNDYNNTQLLPLITYPSYDEIKNNISNITNHSNNRMIRLSSYQFDIVNSSSQRMILDSGEINLNE